MDIVLDKEQPVRLVLLPHLSLASRQHRTNVRIKPFTDLRAFRGKEGQAAEIHAMHAPWKQRPFPALNDREGIQFHAVGLEEWSCSWNDNLQELPL